MNAAPEAWALLGACRGQSADLFFPEAGDVGVALEICKGCSVRAECLEYSLREHIEHGVWGGKTARERKQLRRKRRRAA